MDDSYPSFLTWVFWAISGVLVFFAVVSLTPIGKTVENRGQAVVVFLFFAAISDGVGFITQGSRSHDDLREANRRVNEAQLAFDDADRDYKAVIAGQSGSEDSQVSSTSDSMDYETCLRRIREMSSAYGAPVNLVETNDVRSVRFPVSDGSVLITCSRPDRKMVLTESTRR